METTDETTQGDVDRNLNDTIRDLGNQIKYYFNLLISLPLESLPSPLAQTQSSSDREGKNQAVNLLEELADELDFLSKNSEMNATATKEAIDQAIRTVKETLKSINQDEGEPIDDIIDAINPGSVLEATRPSNISTSMDKPSRGYSKEGQNSTR